MRELEKPGRDPREGCPPPVLRSDVLSMEDLQEGMVLTGTVRNVIDFGVFVDIGVHQDGLVHISQICDRFIKHPLEAVRLGDVVQVKVLSVDLQKKRIALTMKGFEKGELAAQAPIGRSRAKNSSASHWLSALRKNISWTRLVVRPFGTFSAKQGCSSPYFLA